MIGDENTQPNEGVQSLSQLAELMDGGEEIDGDEAPATEDSEESEDAETVNTEEEESEEEESEEPAKQKFTIVHDGKEVELELSPEEHLEMLQKSFDYSKKTMALAEERKALEPIRKQADEYRQQQEQTLKESVHRLQAYSDYMAQQVGSPPPISLAQQDAASYLAQKELYEARKGQLHEAYAEIQRLNDEQARQRQASIAERAESTEKALQDTLPGWNDDMLKELADYTGALGLTPQTADMAILEPGFWQLAQKAKAYDAIQAEKAKLKPVNQLQKVHKPSATNQPPQLAKQQDAIKRHKANPSIGTLADLL